MKEAIWWLTVENKTFKRQVGVTVDNSEVKTISRVKDNIKKHGPKTASKNKI